MPAAAVCCVRRWHADESHGRLPRCWPAASSHLHNGRAAGRGGAALCLLAGGGGGGRLSWGRCIGGAGSKSSNAAAEAKMKAVLKNRMHRTVNSKSACRSEGASNSQAGFVGVGCWRGMSSAGETALRHRRLLLAMPVWHVLQDCEHGFALVGLAAGPELRMAGRRREQQY